MKKYIILTPSIGDMGGAQMYTSNKIDVLRQKGWETVVYYSLPYKSLLIDNLREFKGNFLPDMQYSVHYLPNKRVENVINTICQRANDYEDFVVETQLVALVGWGEKIAEKTGGRHIINFLEEHPHALSGREVAYFEFKLKRREIINASEASLKRLFGTFYKDEYLKYEHKSGFFCSNVVSETSFDDSSIKNADFNILSIGRLDKPYIETLVLELKKFAQKNNTFSFNVHFVGGSNSGSVEKWIEQELGNIENVNLYMFGFVYPIPSGLVEKADVAVASANSILVTAERGCPTISIDMADYGGIGVFGYTTENKFNRTIEPFVPISELLEQVLIKNPIDVSINEKSNNNSGRSLKQMEESVDYIGQMDGNKIYYDIKELNSGMERYYCLLKWFVHQYLGIKKEKKG